MDNEKNKIISDIEKLNKDLANKNERIQSLQNKLAENEKIIELNKKSETLKKMIDRFETDVININLGIEKKQKRN